MRCSQSTMRWPRLLRRRPSRHWVRSGWPGGARRWNGSMQIHHRPSRRLQAAAAELLPRGVSGAMLAGLEDGWAAQLDEHPDPERLAKRGAILFEIGAKLLGEYDQLLEPAGRIYACAVAMRAGLDLELRSSDEIRKLSRHRFPRALRPLTALARLAARDIKQAPIQEPEATPGRAAALLSHRMFGIIA